MRNKLQQQQRSKFLPMLCSSSSTSKEVKLSHRRCASSSSSVSVFEEPSSPRVGCMGQVKRNNKVVGFPSIISFTTSFSGNSSNNSTLKKSDQHHSSNAVKYHNLRSFFSSRNPASSPTTTTTRSGTHRSRTTGVVNNRPREADHHHGSSRRICRSSMIDEKNHNANANNGSDVKLEELDPPLPVVKQVQKQEEGCSGERGNLWKRRSGGAPLKSLQLQAIHQSCTLPSANTV